MISHWSKLPGVNNIGAVPTACMRTTPPEPRPEVSFTARSSFDYLPRFNLLTSVIIFQISVRFDIFIRHFCDLSFGYHLKTFFLLWIYLEKDKIDTHGAWRQLYFLFVFKVTHPGQLNFAAKFHSSKIVSVNHWIQYFNDRANTYYHDHRFHPDFELVELFQEYLLHL